MLELWRSLSEMSAGMGIAAVCLYLYHQQSMRMLDEREASSQEMREMLNRYSARMTESLQVTGRMVSEMEALRVRTDDFMARCERKLEQIDRHFRGEDNRGRYE